MSAAHPTSYDRWKRNAVHHKVERPIQRAGKAVAIAQTAGFVVDLGGLYVMARHVSPEAFGQMVMIAPAIALLAILVDAGQLKLTVQRETLDQATLSRSFWLNVAAGAAMAVLMLLAAPLIAAFYVEPIGAAAMVMATTLFLGGLSVQHRALLLRSMAFGRLGWITLGAHVLGTGAGVAAALMGFGLWALVTIALVTSLATLAGVSMGCQWRPSRPALRSLFDPEIRAFGTFVTGSQLLGFWQRNLDDVLLGKFAGTVELGFYTRAYALLMLPLRKIVYPLGEIAIPALARLQTLHEPLRVRFLSFVAILCAISVPSVVFISWQADMIVALLLGPQWEPVATFFRAMAPAALLTACASALHWLYVTTGRIRPQFRAALVLTILRTIAIVIGLAWGALGVAIAISAVEIVRIVPHCWHATRGTPISTLSILTEIARPLSAATAAVVVTQLVFARLGPLPLFGAFIGAGLAFSVLYLLAYLALPGGRVKFRAMLAEIRSDVVWASE